MFIQTRDSHGTTLVPVESKLLETRKLYIEGEINSKQANDFAAALLLPSDTFGRDAEAGPQSLPYYKKLKQKWKVSIAAMLRRSKELGILAYDNYQTLIKIMQKRGQRKEEPLDDILITAEPSYFRMAVIMLLQEDVFTPREFMHELSSEYGFSVYPEEVEHLLRLPEGTLTSSKIVDISSLQLRNRGDRN